MSLAGYTRLPTGQFIKDSDGSGPYNFDGTTMNLPATGSGGGGGGGDASAANQATQITAEQAIQASAATIATNTGVSHALVAGSAIVGKVGIDQTTPGTTNAVQVTGTVPLPTGAATAAKQPALGTAGTASTDVITVQGIASGTAQPVSLAALPALVAGSAIVGKVGIDQTTPGTTNLVSIGTNGTVAINAAIPAGTNLIGKVGIDQTTPGTTNGVQVNAALPAGTNLMGKVGIDQTTPGTTNGVVATGAAASGASVSGNPLLNGSRAATAAPTAVTDGQAIAMMTDKVGRQVVVAGQVRDLCAAAALTITSSTGATSFIAAIASTFTDISSLVITNSSATATLVTLSDGTASYIYSIAANGGMVCAFPSPLKATTLNVAWTLTCGTSVASIYAVATYFKNT